MKRFLSRLKAYYGDFYKEGKFNQEVALGYMHDKSELNNRIKYIEGIFKVVKKTSKKEVWAWISSTHSLRDIATLYGINKSTFISAVNYENKKIDALIEWKDTNILEYVIYAEQIPNYEWSQLWIRLQSMLARDADKVINKNQMMINISNKYFQTEVSDKEFDDFINVLKPYLVEQRSKAQKRLNRLTEAIGYFNYINSKNMIGLRDIDKKRKKRMMELLDTEEEITVDGVADEDNTIVDKGAWIEEYHKYENELTEEERHDWLYPKGTRVQF